MCNIKYQVCIITGTRAEYGLLRQLLLKFQECDEVCLKLVVTGSHLNKEFGNTQDEIISDGFKDYIKVPIPLDNDSKEGMAFSTGVALTEFSKLFSVYKPDIIIVLGDRFEIFSATVAAHLIGIPVAHISGGDVTEGAVDDAIRHCITKMSYLHFPGCEQSAKRIIQLGEKPERVFNVGELGVENCLNTKLMSRNQLAENLQFNITKNDYSVVTFHPVTMEKNTEIEQVYELIKAMNRIPNMFYIITMSNADAGGRAINDIWLKESKHHSNWLVVTSLGVLRYLSTVKYAKLVIGNSSSGIIEAPSLGTPTINIGDRQKGRMMADTIICCKPEENEIYNSMNKALNKDFQEMSLTIKSPFGDGTTSDKIVKHVIEYLHNKCNNNEKHFYDIEF